ncbi:MAG TPA: tail fiber protein [Terracidiphilus sp.]
MDPYVGEIRLVPYNFAPAGWAFCQGQLLNISQNTALFSLVGTYYGGNGSSTFALPNLQGRIAIHQGQGAGLSTYYLGQQGGSAAITLTLGQLPVHTHTIPASAAAAHASAPGPAFALGSGARGSGPIYATPLEQSTAGINMSTTLCGAAGGNQPHDNTMPYLVLNYIIAMQGIYPPRN